MKISLHRLLKRQIKRIFGKSYDLSTLPDQEKLFIETISDTYAEFDNEKKFVEHILEVNSQQLNQKNKTLANTLSLLSEAQRLNQTGSWHFDLKSQTMEWSKEMFRIMEMDSDEVKPSFELGLSYVHPEDRDKISLTMDIESDDKLFEQIYRLKLPSKKIKYVHEYRHVFLDSSGTPLYIQGTIQDVTRQKRAEEELNLFANVFHSSGQAILITNADKKIIAVNDALTKLTGYSFEDLKGKDPKIFSAGDTPDKIYKEMYQSLKENAYWQGELNDRKKNGEIYPKWLTISTIYNSAGEVQNYICNFSDISERKADQKRINYLAHFDSLTGLLNRYSLDDRLEQAIRQARRHSKNIAVIFIDMDRFKSINDNFGHSVADILLKQVADRLRGSVRDNDIVARQGGDEFVIGLTDIDDPSQVIALAHWLRYSLSLPYDIEHKQIHSSPSIGISIFPHDGDKISELMKNADAAMYHAKELGRNNFQFYSEEINKVVRKRIQIEQDLRTAIQENQFKLVYQPKFNTHDENIHGVEALIRWHHPKNGFISPADFIPIAEETGIIHELGDWIIKQACIQLYKWNQIGLTELSMAINISTKQVHSDNLYKIIKETLSNVDIKAENIELEITETAAMVNPDQAIRNLENLHQLGLKIAIDDFGTGYSSLAYIKSLPVNTLKLDQTFVRDIETDKDDAAICKATISLAHDLGLKIVAEGVETAIQRDYLREHHCDLLQGYFYSKPLSADDMTKFIFLLKNNK